MFLVPDYVFFTKGVGVHKEKLQSFESALRDAGVEQQNLVEVSSILPPNCKIISKKEGKKNLVSGGINFCVLAREYCDEPGRKVSASVGLAYPADKKKYGYLSEYHGFGRGAKESGEYAEDLAATMLATTLGISFNPDDAWDERKKIYKSSDIIINSKSITAATKGDDKARWTCAVAIAVFLFDNGKIN